jgi:hypothetical protein
MSKSLLRQLKSSRNTSDAIAKQIEARFKKADGRLSAEYTEIVVRPAPAEEAFLALARAAFRAADREGRIKLRAMLTERR